MRFNAYSGLGFQIPQTASSRLNNLKPYVYDRDGNNYETSKTFAQLRNESYIYWKNI